ncbi:MAG: hypothetical protein EOO20_04980 [Chryseobacterium sp.]|nr:MAG: hypothetical protein EOO20_04980 [Chryseobacterium sp.]
MDNAFIITIALNLKKKKLPYGKFCLGRDKGSSMEIFSILKGKIDAENTHTIQMELCQEIAGLYVTIGKLFCSLEELKENTSAISKEIFRIAQLEEGDIIPLE